MPSQVYYRKWRPKKFAHLVGQEHVSTTLRQAVAQGRVAHAYLFCGPRGTGKTSTARILAKAVNCLESQDGEPCDRCALCQPFNEGRLTDLIELDAASNRGIDEIRNIREKVLFAPSLGRYKVYIIDEAHMLTDQASNAFLKTLEEPPGHVIFALCTTEAHKVLPTIISRCQRFDFRRLSLESIIGQLQRICVEEGLEVDLEALKAIARSAAGSLRDAENLLEQMVLSYGSKVGLVQVQEALGLRGTEESLELVRHILKGNVSDALATVNRAVWNGMDVRQLHRHAVDYLRGALVIKCGAEETLDQPAETVQQLRVLAESAPLPRITQSLRRLGEVNLRYVPTSDVSPLPLELAVVEACAEETQPATPIIPRTPAPSIPRAGTPRPRSVIPSTPRPPRIDKGVNPPAPVEANSTPIKDEAPAGGPAQSGDLQAVIKSLSRFKGKRFNIGGLLRDCKSHHREGEDVTLVFSHRSNLERMQEEMEDPQCRNSVESAFAKVMGSPCSLKLTLAEGGNGPNGASVSSQSPLVRAALGMGARIVQEKEGNE